MAQWTILMLEVLRLALKDIVGQAVLPREGRLSQSAQAMESEPEFVRLRPKHSAVESAINALEVRGLDAAPTTASPWFKRYVALAVVVRKLLQRMGVVLKGREARRRGAYKKAA
jgi:IS5 family transposase